MNWIRNSLRRLRTDERGIAMIVVMGVMLVLSLLAAAAVTASMNFNQSSVKDSRVARAQAAANAGLEAGLYNLAKRGIAADQCLTNDATTPVSSWNTANPGPHCVTSTNTATGGNATYKFWVSPAFDATVTGTTATQLQALQTACGGGSASAERCITATGTASGITRRVRMRVSGKPLFPIIGGFMGFQGVTFTANPNWGGSNMYPAADVGTNNENGFFVGGNNTMTRPCNGTAGDTSASGNACTTGTKNLCITPSGTKCGGAGSGSGNQGYAATLSAPSIDELAWDASKTSNAADVAATAPAGYDKPTRYWNVTGTVTLQSGVYNFCSIRLQNNAKILAAANARVEIYLDSKRRDVVWGSSVSGCPQTNPTTPAAINGMIDGDFTGGTQGSTAISSLLDGGSTGRLDFFVYGTKAPATKGATPPPGGGSLTPGNQGSPNTYTTCGDDFEWRNTFATPADANNVYIFAPNSNVIITSNAKIYGAITACTTSFWAYAQGAGFASPQSTIPPPTGAPKPINGSFRQCIATATDPESGPCNG
jgi:Tfp pilus assembly protein PilX